MTFNGNKVTVIVYLIFLVLGLGIVFFQALPYLQDKYHSNIVSNRVYFAEMIPTYIYLKQETSDAFTANNPINISITTGITPKEIRGIQLTFDGAESCFPRERPEYPEINFSEPLKEYYKKVDEYFNKSEEFDKKCFNNIISLQQKTTRVSEISHFSGGLSLTYPAGGDFDIGITIIRSDGGVAGYEMGNRQSAIKGAIHISPPEALYSIRNYNRTAGLALLALGLTFVLHGINGLTSKK